jgi:hypothetical protein
MVSNGAVGRGDLEILRWIRQHGCSFDGYALGNAASSGNIEVAAWVMQQPGVVCSEADMSAAAIYGHTDMCQYLRAEQCPWDEGACNGAARFGRVNTLRWLQDNGCPWHAGKLCREAAEGSKASNVDVLIYLQEQGIASPAMLTVMLNSAGECTKLATAQWLRQQGAEWPVPLKRWTAQMLAWTRAEGCTSLHFVW